MSIRTTVDKSKWSLRRSRSDLGFEFTPEYESCEKGDIEKSFVRDCKDDECRCEGQEYNG